MYQPFPQEPDGATIFGHSTAPLDYMPDFITGRPHSHAVHLTADDRARHVLILGQTGGGKTTLLEHLISAELAAGRGCLIADPHGDLAVRALELTPRRRTSDVIYLNPSDVEFPVPLNVLATRSSTEHHLVASGLVSIFERLWRSSWGPRTEYVLKNAVLALLECPAATLIDVKRLLVDVDFRAHVLRQVRNPAVRDFWTREFAAYPPAFREEVIAPVLNKLGTFTMTPLLRHIVGQRRNSFTLRSAMDEGKIVVANLAKGAIGEDASVLLGSMLLSEAMLAAFSRVDLPEASRRPFTLFIDEFASFASPATLGALLAEARKFGVSAVLCGQFLAQAPIELRAALLGNVGTIISFRVGAEDAEVLAAEMPPLAPTQLVSLDRHHVYVKRTVSGTAMPPVSAITLPPTDGAPLVRERIIRASRQRYGRPRAAVEREASQREAASFAAHPFPGPGPMAGAKGGVSRRRAAWPPPNVERPTSHRLPGMRPKKQQSGPGPARA